MVSAWEADSSSGGVRLVTVAHATELYTLKVVKMVNFAIFNHNKKKFEE